MYIIMEYLWILYNFDLKIDKRKMDEKLETLETLGIESFREDFEDERGRCPINWPINDATEIL